MLSQPFPCRRFLLFGNPVHHEALGAAKGIEPVEKGQRSPMTVLATQEGPLSVDIRCDVLPPYLRYRRVFANLSEVPPVALFR